MARRDENKSPFFLMEAIVGCLLSSDVVQADEPFNYFANDLNVVSLTDYNRGTRISSKNGLVISGDNERKEHEPDTNISRRPGKNGMSRTQ